jgi:hypothetical protein
LSSRRWSFLGTSPEHRKTRILKLALGFDIGTPDQVFQAGICSKQSMGGLHADLRGLEHKQPHCLVKWQPGCLPRDPWLSVPASQQVWRLTIKKGHPCMSDDHGHPAGFIPKFEKALSRAFPADSNISSMTLSTVMTQFVIASAEFCHNVRHIPSKALLDHRNRNA